MKDCRWTEDISGQLSGKNCQRWTGLMCCLDLTFRSTSSHTSSMGFKSIDCTSQNMNWRTCCSFLLLIYLWRILLLCFGSLSWMNTDPWATSCVRDGIAWSCNMCYIITEFFFLLIIFRWLYFIIQFGWALKYSCVSSGAQTLGTVYARTQRIWQSQLS